MPTDDAAEPNASVTLEYGRHAFAGEGREVTRTGEGRDYAGLGLEIHQRFGLQNDRLTYCQRGAGAANAKLLCELLIYRLN